MSKMHDFHLPLTSVAAQTVEFKAEKGKEAEEDKSSFLEMDQ